MKVFNIKKINRFLKKYTGLLVSALILFTKKERPEISLVLVLISMLGIFMNNDKSELSNSKEMDNTSVGKTWKEYIHRKMKKVPDDISILSDDDLDTTTENTFEYTQHSDQSNQDSEIENTNKEMTLPGQPEFIESVQKRSILENIKKSIKTLHTNIKEKRANKKVDKTLNIKPYVNKIQKLNKEYDDRENHFFELKVNDNNKNLPIFNLRSSDNIDFYWNFHLHNADNTRINNLILCRDIHQWMNSSSISDEDLDNKCYPLYLIIKDHKNNNEIMIFEAYKVFVYINENGNKQAFISKGDNYKTIEEILNILVEMDYIKDLLNGKDYESYNLTSHDSVCLFLNNTLSHFLPSDSQNGEVINIDLKQYNENRETFDYFYHTFNCDNDMFNTNI